MLPPEPVEREIRARYDKNTLTVYQAYGHAIANKAIINQTFVAPFKRDRMTWIKPSFLWMMYRCGWGEKSAQNRVLAIKITHQGFRWALGQACLSHYHPGLYASEEDWLARKAAAPVRLQWDPERSLRLGRLNYRSLQVGLSGEAVERYVTDWIRGIEDVTPLAKEIKALVEDKAYDAARARLPEERPYPLPQDLGRQIGLSQYESAP